MAAGSSSTALVAPKRKWGSPLPQHKPRIEIIPLIDVMFFLLASFMMVSLSMEKSQTLPMSLPTTVHARDAFRPDALQIGVEQDGRISLGTERVEWGTLDAELQRRFRVNPTTPIFVSADRNTPHAAIQRVLGRIRSAGFQQISFVTDHQGGASTEGSAALEEVVEPSESTQSR